MILCNYHHNKLLFQGTYLYLNKIVKTNFSDKYFITTPIYYINSSPHIGHFYTNVLADTVARWKKLKGFHIIFSTGTDEHGQKVEEAAEKQNMEPSEFSDKMSSLFNDLFISSNINYTKFIRTSDLTHIKVVQTVWKELMKSGLIYEGHYSGWYSVTDETFIHDNDLISDSINSNGEKIKVIRATNQPVKWVKEKNYIFKLSLFTERILNIIETNIIEPEEFKPIILKWIKSGLKDLSVSRHISRLSWGIPVPGDPNQLIYVWLDALTNYLTAAEYPKCINNWPADCHVVGKDILKFHSVYWLAFLIALKLPLPKKIICHSHWTINKEKMSKSLGNVINPLDKIKEYTADGLRYYLMKESSLQSDSNYNDERAIECINSDLVNTFANLFSRSTSKILNSNQIVPNFNMDLLNCEKDIVMMNKLYKIADTIDPYYSSFRINHALEIIMDQLRQTNAFFEHHKPWKLDKQDPALSTILAVALETLRVTSIAMQPVIPDLTNIALNMLNIDNNQRSVNDMKSPIKGRNLRIFGNNILLPRLKYSTS